MRHLSLNFVLFFLGVIILTVSSPHNCFPATTIEGRITELRDDAVKVTYKQYETMIPSVGDLVDFKTENEGVPVDAGQGKVIEIKTGFVWVKILKGLPDEGMDATIHINKSSVLTNKQLDELFIKNVKKLSLDEPDKEEGLKLLIAYHESGNRDATGYLGQIYSLGQGVPKNVEKGLCLAKQSADANSLIGHFVLYYNYKNGIGLEPDFALTLKHLKIAADGGHPVAMYELGTLYHLGKNIDQDLKKAFYLFEKGAIQSDWPSYWPCLYMLGYYYEKGYVVKKDINTAISYYEKVHKQNPNTWTKSALQRLNVKIE
ncbi:MAG: tetratricopeptide repeat protein [Pseudomonadota bacterium]